MPTDPIVVTEGSRAIQTFCTRPLSGSKHTLMVSIAEGVVYFWDGKPFAVLSGGVVYILDKIYTAAQWHVINQVCRFNDLAPVIRVSPRDFDFVLGSCLTRLGLQLTRAPRDSDA